MEPIISPLEWVAAHRRAVLGVALVAVGLLVLARLTLLADVDADGTVLVVPLFRNVVDALLATVAVSATIAGFLWWFRTPVSRTHAGAELFPDQISTTLERGAADSDEWEYVGHTGTYVRSRILPLLERRAKNHSILLKVRFVILNPFDDRICAQYALYRTNARSSTLNPKTWTRQRVQIELLATIICLLRSKSMYPQLDISLGIRGNFGLFRYDKSQHNVVMTQEDPQQPAYLYLRGSRFFTYCRQECELAWIQSEQFSINIKTQELENLDQIARGLTEIFGRRIEQYRDLLPEAARLAVERISPYA